MISIIAIVEQCQILRAGLVHFFNLHFAAYSIIEFENVEEAAEGPGLQHPVLFILGLNSCRLTRGLAQLNNVRSKYPAAKIVIYDEVADPDSAFRFLKEGACGYLARSETAVSLKNAVDRVLGGQLYVAKNILDIIFQERIFGWEKRLSRRRALTKSEFLIASYLADGLNVTKIATILNKHPSTVSVQKWKILKKLGIDTVEELEAIIR